MQSQITMISPNWPYEPAMQIDAELQSLRGQLSIDAAQQSLWDAFAQQVRASSLRFHQQLDELVKDDPKMHRFGTHQRLQRARMRVYDEVHPSYLALYRAMSPSQQESFNNLLIGSRKESCGLLCRDGMAR